MAALIFLSLLLMAAIDFFTGQELVFSCAYLIPVLLTAWHFSRRGVIIVSSLSGVTALVVDHLDGYEYSHPGIGYWNGFTCFGISLVTGLILHRLRRTLVDNKLANDELRQALADLQESTEKIRALQNGLQVVCSWTKRLKVGDQWLTPEEFLRDELHLHIGHGVSPEARAKIDEQFPEPDPDALVQLNFLPPPPRPDTTIAEEESGNPENVIPMRVRPVVRGAGRG